MKVTSARADSYISWEVFFLGGFSILFSLAFWCFMDSKASLYNVSMVAFSLAFIANHPHFLSSYILLYGDYRKSILKKKGFFWAGVIVPLLLISALLFALAQQRIDLLGHLVTSMFFLVGWHYVKQIFGCVIVTSSQRQLYYSPWEKRLLLTNLGFVWMMSWIRSHIGNSQFRFYQIPHSSLDLPAWLMTAVYAGVAVTAFGVVALVLMKYIREGRVPPPGAVVAFISIYAWYIPVINHPGFAYFIPFFHSIQYLFFVWILKTNKVKDRVQNLQGVQQRKTWVLQFLGFFAGALILGALFFEFIPKRLDSAQLLEKTVLGPTPILAAFLLFINIHHYFIDNVIWRSDNAELKKYLF